MTQTGAELRDLLDVTHRRLVEFTDEETTARPALDKWSKKEIIGHLIDSAANNQHRFICAQQLETDEEFIFPGYEQDHWVESQAFNQSSWTELIELWRLYNQHVSRVMDCIPANKLTTVCKIGSYEPVTLGFLVEDYVDHQKHHLAQLGVWPT